MSHSGAPSPVPPPPGAGGGGGGSGGGVGGGEDTAAAAADNWRSSVQQSYRNTEVREIAKVLAALEPGASASSKLRLAMQFEDLIFQAATSLADYRKRLTKRLKKVSKSYTPPQQDLRRAMERRLLALRQRYGASLRYILDHSDTAVEEMRRKHGPEKAQQFRQHTDGVKTWAADLGVPLAVAGSTGAGASAAGSEGTTGTAAATTAADAMKPPNAGMSEEQYDKLRGHLERRVENIRSHVVKLADPDLFLLETIQKTVSEFHDRPSKMLAVNACKRYEQYTKQPKDCYSKDLSKVRALVEQALEGVHRTVPPATRREDPAAVRTHAALVHLSRMRSASLLNLAWMMTPLKTAPPFKHLLKGALEKAHAAANEGTDYVVRLLQERRKQQSHGEEDEDGNGGDKAPAVTLEDAWMKTLDFPLSTPADALAADQPPPSANEATTTDGGGEHATGVASKRLRASTGTHGLPPTVRTRVLLAPGRKPPSNLLPALKRKRAVLIRPAPYGEGAHLILHFGAAFTMTIYFRPLLVTIRAYNEKRTKQSSTTTTTSTMGTCALMTPISDGLIWDDDDDYDSDSDDDDDDKGNKSQTKNAPGNAYNQGSGAGSSSGQQQQQSQQQKQQQQDRKQQQQQQQEEGEALTVWGVDGSYRSVGRVVEERLQDASAHCTYVLRKTFEHAAAAASTAGHPKAPSSSPSFANEFEIEIREATALLEFVQLCRTTYIPNWQDDDDD